MRNRRVKVVALYGLLIALALILSYLEAQIPAFVAVPGMKLGLTNLVVIVALYLLGGKSAMAINILRILLVGLLFGNGMSLLYSLGGGILSGVLMILLKRTGKLSTVTVSVVGGISHNVGQILVAMALMQTAAVAWYLVILWFTGLVSGAVIGLVGGILVRRLQKLNLEGKPK